MAITPPTPFAGAIARYFPDDQLDNARCIQRNECSDGACVADEGYINCQGTSASGMAHSWGGFQILDVCWSPYINPESPFTKEQWDRVLEPEMNAWMASAIWSRSGWRLWTTCEKCEVCGVLGGPIPYPRGPIDGEITSPPIQSNNPLPTILLGLGLLLTGAIGMRGLL